MTAAETIPPLIFGIATLYVLATITIGVGYLLWRWQHPRPPAPHHDHRSDHIAAKHLRTVRLHPRQAPQVDTAWRAQLVPRPDVPSRGDCPQPH